MKEIASLDRKSVEVEIVICPNCKGVGYKIDEKRVGWDETEYTSNECYLYKGKRVVVKKVTIEHLEVK